MSFQCAVHPCVGTPGSRKNTLGRKLTSINGEPSINHYKWQLLIPKHASIIILKFHKIFSSDSSFHLQLVLIRTVQGPSRSRHTQRKRIRRHTVSQIWSLMGFLSTVIILEAKTSNSVSMVGSWRGWNRLSVNCSSRHDLPTPAQTRNQMKAGGIDLDVPGKESNQELGDP